MGGKEIKRKKGIINNTGSQVHMCVWCGKGWVIYEGKLAVNRLVPCQEGYGQNISYKMGKLACAAVHDRHMLRQTAPHWNSACLMDIQRQSDL